MFEVYGVAITIAIMATIKTPGSSWTLGSASLGLLVVLCRGSWPGLPPGASGHLQI